MSWLNNLKQRIEDTRALRAFERSAFCSVARTAIRELWLDNKLFHTYHSPDFIEKYGVKLMREAMEVYADEAPLLKNRDALVGALCEAAALCPLVIRPEGTPDESGLRGRPGITGALGEAQPRLVAADEQLREWFQRAWTTGNPDDLFNLMLARYRFSFIRACVFNRLRSVTGDPPTSESEDWFRPFFAALVANYECRYRAALGLPSSFETAEQERALSVRLQAWFDAIVAGRTPV